MQHATQPDPAMDSLTTAIRDAMEQAAISGLCREGQIEIGAQEARKLRPDLPDEERLALAKAIYKNERREG